MSRKKRIPWLLIPGLALILAGLAGLYSGPEISQYVFLPSESEYSTLLTQAEEKWAGTFPATALHGVAEGVSVASEKKTQDQVNLYEVTGGYSEIYPRRFASGRALSRGDGKEAVIVLDEELAFLLFGDSDPLEKTVTVNEKKFRVVGVAAHIRRTGESGAYTAWIPLEAEGAPERTVMVLSAGGKAGSSFRTVFETNAREVFGSGQAVFLSKERTRGTVMLRLVLIVLAIRLLTAWTRCWSGWTRKWIAEIRSRLKVRYPRQIAGQIAGRGMEILLLAAVTTGAFALLTVWASGLLTEFPEWVPENLVSPEAISQRFRELTAAAAAPLQFRTPELAEIRFGSGLVRWGIVTSLLGWILWKLPRRKQKDLPELSADN